MNFITTKRKATESWRKWVEKYILAVGQTILEVDGEKCTIETEIWLWMDNLKRDVWLRKDRNDNFDMIKSLLFRGRIWAASTFSSVVVSIKNFIFLFLFICPCSCFVYIVLCTNSNYWPILSSWRFTFFIPSQILSFPASRSKILFLHL